MKLGIVLLVEIILFWALLYCGAIIDKSITMVAGDPQDTSMLTDIATVCLQVVLITLISINLRPFVLKHIVRSTSPYVWCVGLLYGFALLLPQDKFKDRVKTITKL